MEDKDRILRGAGAQANCERIAIAADLTTPWETALIDAGFDQQQPAAWLLEGFLFYLEVEDLTAVLDRVLSFTAQGSAVGFDIINGETLTSPYTKAWVEMQAKSGAPWIGTLDDPDGFLSARGWKATLSGPGLADANFGRWSLPVIPPAMLGMPHLWYVTAEKA
jgi:methyltransferase (TIGR00027 family)